MIYGSSEPIRSLKINYTPNESGTRYLSILTSNQDNVILNFIVDQLNFSNTLNIAKTNGISNRTEYDIDLFLNADINYELEIKCSIDVIFYQIELKIKPPTNYISHISPYVPNQFLIIENFDKEIGGFFWCLRLVAVGLIVAKKYSLIPVIDLTGGLYYSNFVTDPNWIRSTRSWWNYFFEDPIYIPSSVKDAVINLYPKHMLNPPRHIKKRKRIKQPENNDSPISNAPDNAVFYLNRSWINHIKDYEYNSVCQEIKTLSYINQFIDNFFKQKHIDNTKTMVGIHFRGTDKFPTGFCNEGNPIHYEYDKMCKMIKDKMIEEKQENYLIYCTSDEQPFINYMVSHFGNEQVFYIDHQYRSSISTSGINENLMVNPQRSLSEEQMAKLDYYRKNSVHFGLTECSNYYKGLYTLLDLLPLTRMNYLFVSRSNFSDFARYMNPNNPKIFDMNDA